MKKKLIIIPLLLAVGLLGLYKYDSGKKARQHMMEYGDYLCEKIVQADYGSLKLMLKSEGGGQLSERQIQDYFLNSGLYRSKLADSYGQKLSCSGDINFWDSNTGSITLDFTALNGDIISTTLKYVRDGENEYFIADDITPFDGEKEIFYLATDLAGGQQMQYNQSPSDNYIQSLKVFSTPEGQIALEVVKEAKEDIVISLENSLAELDADLKEIDSAYSLSYSEDYRNFFVYYGAEVESMVLARTMDLQIIASSMLIQGFQGISDWHLNINYYDSTTGRLLHRLVIR